MRLVIMLVLILVILVILLVTQSQKRRLSPALVLALDLAHIRLGCVQVRRERDLLQSRVESAEGEAERERGLHRRELRRKAKEGQEVSMAL